MAPSGSVHSSALRRLLQAAVTGDRKTIGDLVTDDVVGWSPALFAVSRDELLAAMAQQDDAFSAVEIEVHALDELGDKVVAEWRLSADHTGPMLIGEAAVIPPSDRRLQVSGATIAEFDGNRICAFRSYFDDMAFVEQALLEG